MSEPCDGVEQASAELLSQLLRGEDHDVPSKPNQTTGRVVPKP